MAEDGEVLVAVLEADAGAAEVGAVGAGFAVGEECEVGALSMGLIGVSVVVGWGWG